MKIPNPLGLVAGLQNPVRWLQAGLVLAGVLAIAGAALAVRGWQVDSAALADCRALAGVSHAKPAEPPRCDAKLRQLLDRAAAAAACDQALGRGEAGSFAVLQACSPAVKRLVADRDAARADVVQRDGEITQLKADRSAEVARAEARGLLQAQRSAHATKVLDAAPRDDRGRIACDADCLSVLAGDPP